MTGQCIGNPIYANTISASNAFSNITIDSDLQVNGSVSSGSYMDVGMQPFAVFRLVSNVPIPSGEFFAESNTIALDMSSTNMNGTSTIPTSVLPYQIYNANTGVITVPYSGLYTLYVQGSFSNDPAAVSPMNGVYYKLPNHPYPDARVAANVSASSIVSSSFNSYFLEGDLVKPVYFSSDSNAVLLATSGETCVGFTIQALSTPDSNNYTRV